MRLGAVTIRDFRSLFVDEHGEPFRAELGTGMNTFVGRNNCGKSNVLRAVELALDPHYPFDPDADIPGPRRFSHPRVELTFVGDEGDEADRELLALARSFEAARGVTTASAAGRREVRLEVSYPPLAEGGYRRCERIVAARSSEPSVEDPARDVERELIGRLRDSVRFVLIRSGETLQSVLEGNFREILHNVIRERLEADFARAEQSRHDYIRGLQDSLLAPLRDQLAGDVAELFPDIDGIRLTPKVSDIEETLSQVGVSLHDVIDTPLTGKGTGVRGGVLVAMLRYLAGNATRGMVLAMEEPEAFLHPSAQEDLRDNLEVLAESRDVSLLVTTHSPFIVAKRDAGRVFALGKDRDGRTRVSRTAAGNEPHAPLIGDLVHEATFEDVLARASDLSDDVNAVLLVEGEGDLAYLELACARAGRPELIADLAIRPTGGTRKMVAQAVVARAATEKPVAVLVDNDQPGIEARKQLCEKFGFQNRREVFSYALVFPKDQRNFPYEAEDLFPPAVIESFVDRHGHSIVEGSRKRPDAEFHYDFDESGKELLSAHLVETLRPGDVGPWIELLKLIRGELGLVATARNESVTTSAVPAVQPEAVDDVLVVVGPHELARYRANEILVVPNDEPPPASIRYVGFYAEGHLEPLVPRILGRYDSLRFDQQTVDALRATGSDIDERAAAVVTHSLDRGDQWAGTVQHLLVLSGPEDEDTLRLEAPVENTKVNRKGRPLAWAVEQRLTSSLALRKNPKTTDELEALEREPGG